MSYTHLSAEERYVIYHLRLCRLSFREIGRRLGRSHTTISREVVRNRRGRDRYVPKFAAVRCRVRRHKARHHRRWSHKPLRDYVWCKLQQDWSPEQISGRLKRDYPRSSVMRVSVETIYTWVYREVAEGRDVHQHLRFSHRKRRKQRRYGAGRGLIRGRIGIKERPLSVDDRRYYGDWEGDTVEGAKASGGLATHVDRKSRYLLVGRLPDKRAKTMTDQSIKLFDRLPPKMRRTLTLDNGKEFADFKRLEAATGLAVYFADPYAPYQRGCNENTNGLLRQYFPKGNNFADIKEKDIETAMKKLNHRPRKSLGFKTPHEVLNAATGGALTI